jgi:hypothetical protein
MAITPTTEKVHIYMNLGDLIVNPGVARIGGRYPQQIKFFNNTDDTLVLDIPGGLGSGRPLHIEIPPHKASDPYPPVSQDLAVVYTVTTGKLRGIGGSDPVIIIDT